MGFSAEASLVHVRQNIQWIIRKRYQGTKERQVEDGVEELGFPHKTLGQ